MICSYKKKKNSNFRGVNVYNFLKRESYIRHDNELTDSERQVLAVGA